MIGGRLMDAESFDPAELDDGIRDVVLAMRDAGFDTIGSCQGGQGHAHLRPIVFVRSRGRAEDECLLLSKWAENLQEKVLITALGSPEYTGTGRLVKLEILT